MHVKHTSPNTNTSLAKAHLGWGSELEDGEKVGQVVPEQNPWLRYIWCRFFYCKNSKGQKIKPEIMIAIFFPLQIGQKHWQNKYLRTLPVTLMVSRPFLALVQAVALIVYCLKYWVPGASLLHCLHWRHEHNVQPCGVLATESEVIFELLINTDHCV